MIDGHVSNFGFRKMTRRKNPDQPWSVEGQELFQWNGLVTSASVERRAPSSKPTGLHFANPSVDITWSRVDAALARLLTNTILRITNLPGRKAVSALADCQVRTMPRTWWVSLEQNSSVTVCEVIILLARSETNPKSVMSWRLRKRTLYAEKEVTRFLPLTKNSPNPLHFAGCWCQSHPGHLCKATGYSCRSFQIRGTLNPLLPAVYGITFHVQTPDPWSLLTGSFAAQISSNVQARRGAQRRHKGGADACCSTPLEPNNRGWGWNASCVCFCSS